MPSLDDVDPEFPKDLKGSKPAVYATAEELRRRGVKGIVVPELVLRPNVEDRHLYSDDGDILIPQGRLEVKGRPKLFFDSVESFPFDPILVDRKSSYDKKDPVPIAYFIVNGDLSGAIVIDVRRTRSLWTVDWCENPRWRYLAYHLELEHCRYTRYVTGTQ